LQAYMSWLSAAGSFSIHFFLFIVVHRFSFYQLSPQRGYVFTEVFV